MENKYIIFIFIILILGGIYYLNSLKTRNSFVVEAFDKDGNIIKKIPLSRSTGSDLQAIWYEAKGVTQLPEGTASIRFSIVVTNTGNVPFRVTYRNGTIESYP